MDLDEKKLEAAAMAILNHVRGEQGKNLISDWALVENPEVWLAMAKTAISTYLA